MTWTRFGFVCLFLLLLASLCTLLSWYTTSYSVFNRTVRPGGTYKVKGREYVLPDLPVVSRFEDMKNARKDVDVPILSETFLFELRQLMIQVTSTIDDLGKTYYISGGTLIGFATAFGGIIPWDDDCDLHVTWDQREFFFSNEFTDVCAQRGLEVIQLLGQGLQYAHREGAAVRVRPRGQTMPICDIFFVKQREKDGKWVKVDGWSHGGTSDETITFNSKEVWDENDLFPVQKQVLDGLLLSLPRHPEAVLKQQYGPTVGQVMVYTPPLLSHQFPFRSFVKYFWKKREPSSHAMAMTSPVEA